MGFTRVAEAAERIRYQGSAPGASILDLLREPKTPGGELGAGIVHHIAFRTPTDAQQERWQRELAPSCSRLPPIRRDSRPTSPPSTSASD
jgi:glyoxalase family protein